MLKIFKNENKKSEYECPHFAFYTYIKIHRINQNYVSNTRISLAVFIFDLGCQVVSDVSDLPDVVLYDQGHIW